MFRRFTDEQLALAEHMAGNLRLACARREYADTECPCCRLHTVRDGICQVCDWGSAWAGVGAMGVSDGEHAACGGCDECCG